MPDEGACQDAARRIRAASIASAPRRQLDWAAVTGFQTSDGFLSNARSPFPPIAHYAFLSDCEACALVAPSGAVEWLCLPRFDSPSICGPRLARAPGLSRLGPGDVAVPAGRR